MHGCKRINPSDDTEPSQVSRGHFVFQVQLAKKVEAVPVTRDYIGDAQARRNVLKKTASASLTYLSGSRTTWPSPS